MQSSWRRLGLGIAFVLAACLPATAQGEAECRLTILTSYPESFYKPLIEGFEINGAGVCVTNKNTISLIAHLEEERRPVPDLVWASSPVAFWALREDRLLASVQQMVLQPAMTGNMAVDALDGTRFGFALSQIGIMWTENLALPVPRDVRDLALPVYAGKIGMTTPARSGTTHLFVEAVLQEFGWEEGWALLSEIGGNLATVTARSFGVPDGVRKGRFPVGIGIDFLAQLDGDAGIDLDFKPLFPEVFPASIALTARGAGNPDATAFIAYLRSEPAQQLLLDPSIDRTPVLPSLWPQAAFTPPADTPILEFDEELAARRLEVVTALFDEMITYRQVELARLWSAVHRFERQAPSENAEESGAILVRLRQLLTTVPVAAFMADGGLLTGAKQETQDGSLTSDRLRMRDSWARDFNGRFERARELIAQLDFIADEEARLQ